VIVPLDEGNKHIAEGIEPMPGASRFIAYLKRIPVAVSDLRESMAVNEPHITWLPGVTIRQKREMFLEGMRFLSGKPIILAVPKSNNGFYEQWVRRGLLRKVGFFDEIPEIEEIHYYQVIRSKLWANQ